MRQLYRILLVDDSPSLLQALAAGFGEHGFRVVTATNGVDAPIQFQAYQGDFMAVLTEHDMPNMNGLTFVKHVRALDYRGRILVMSGHLTATDCRAYHDLGVSGFFHKPFEISMAATMLMHFD